MALLVALPARGVPAGAGRLPVLTVFATHVSNLRRRRRPAMPVNSESWTKAVAQLRSYVAQNNLEN